MFRRRLRRALRHAFTILSALSLLLCVAVCVLWVRSYWVADYVDLIQSTPGLDEPVGQLGSESGTLQIDICTQRAGVPAWDYAGYFTVPVDDRLRSPLFRSTRRFGLEDQLYDWNGIPSGIMVWFPHWLAAGCTLLLPAIWTLRVVRRRRRKRLGHCPDCGYDLRASPERCPECGTAVTNI